MLADADLKVILFYASKKDGVSRIENSGKRGVPIRSIGLLHAAVKYGRPKVYSIGELSCQVQQPFLGR